jgi:hypothetical protein
MYDAYLKKNNIISNIMTQLVTVLYTGCKRDGTIIAQFPNCR